MKKILFFVLMISVSQGAYAGGFLKWYKNLLKGLNAKIESRMSPKVRVTAVAAVRGANQNADPMKLYWKGGISEKAVKKLKAEKKEFAAAVQKVVDGNTKEGKKLLKAFLKNNPQSVYIKDVKDALSKLSDENKKAFKKGESVKKVKTGTEKDTSKQENKTEK